jgi:GDP-D-mannose dehydratase
VREKLGWGTTVDFAGLVEMMVDADIDLMRRQVS